MTNMASSSILQRRRQTNLRRKADGLSITASTAQSIMEEQQRSRSATPPPPEEPVIDMNFAMKQALDDAEFLLELIELFLADETKHMKNIDECLRKNDHRVSFFPEENLISDFFFQRNYKGMLIQLKESLRISD
jgi:hypothetical protein